MDFIPAANIAVKAVSQQRAGASGFHRKTGWEDECFQFTIRT